ncbi:MAG: TatD family hydrolase [Candidatus Nanohalobium sp.]
MRPVDAHCHIDFEQYDEDRDEVIQRCKEKLEFIVNAGSNLENNRRVLKLGREYPDTVLPNLGLHPTYTESFDELEEIKEQIRDEKPPAVGEIGLDHHHVTDNRVRKKQEKVFREMLELAEDLNLPVVLHTREAERKAINIVKEYSLPDVMLHCFNGKPELAEEAVEEGMKIGITTQVLYSSRVQEIVKALDLEDILLETDSPFLYRGERNSPANVHESAEKIAEIKSVEKEEVVEASTENAVSIFGRP